MNNISLRTRFRFAWEAFKGKDVCPEAGIQRRRPDGRTETLAKFPMAAWVPTDDYAVATRTLAESLDRALAVDPNVVDVDWATGVGQPGQEDPR